MKFYFAQLFGDRNLVKLRFRIGQNSLDRIDFVKKSKKKKLCSKISLSRINLAERKFDKKRVTALEPFRSANRELKS